MKALIIKLLLSYAKPALVDLILSIVIPRLKQEAAKTDNNLDDKAVELIEKTIRDSFK